METLPIPVHSIENKYNDSEENNMIELKSFGTLCIEKYEILHDFANKQSDASESLKVIQSIVNPSINGNSLFINQSSGEASLRPLFSSFITDDHSPVEYSLTFTSNQTKVRLAFESLPTQTNEKTNVITMNDLHNASLETYSTIQDYLNKTTDKTLTIDFEKLKNIFLKTNEHLQTVDEHNPFSTWYGIDFNTIPLFKVYFNLISFYHDSSKLSPVQAVCMGLNAMGINHEASKSLLNVMESLNSRASFIFFTIDLNSSTLNRCKIYVRFYKVSIEELETIASIATNYKKGAITDFIHHFLPNCSGFDLPSSCNSSSTFGPVVTFVFNSSNNNGPDSLKFHLPIRNYISDDKSISQLIPIYLKKTNLFYPNQSNNEFEQIIQDLKISKHNHTGCQTYVSFSSSNLTYAKEFTVYLNPQFYSSGIQTVSPHLRT